jgi:hypothetical protein
LVGPSTDPWNSRSGASLTRLVPDIPDIVAPDVGNGHAVQEKRVIFEYERPCGEGRRRHLAGVHMANHDTDRFHLPRSHVALGGTASESPYEQGRQHGATHDASGGWWGDRRR